MNSLVILFSAILAVACGSPSGLGLGLGLGLGVAGPRTIIVPPSSATIISKPLGLLPALAPAPLIAPALGPIAPWGLAAPAVAPIAPWGLGPAAVAAPIAVPASAVAVTNGGGVVEVSGHGAVVSGPKTAPVIIEGPSGTVKANGLWGPTLAGVLH